MRITPLVQAADELLHIPAAGGMGITHRPASHRNRLYLGRIGDTIGAEEAHIHWLLVELDVKQGTRGLLHG